MFTPPPSENNSTASHYLIVIVVLSTSRKEGRDARDTIRNTWAQDYHKKAPPIHFCFCRQSLQWSLYPSVLGEKDFHIQVYYSISLLKVVQMQHPIPCGTALFGHVTSGATCTACSQVGSGIRAIESLSLAFFKFVSCLYVSLTVDLG